MVAVKYVDIISPGHITEADVMAYRAQHDADEDLIGLLSWSAFGAARRVGEWTAAASGRGATAATMAGPPRDGPG